MWGVLGALAGGYAVLIVRSLFVRLVTALLKYCGLHKWIPLWKEHSHMSKFGMLGGLAVALSKLIPQCFQNPILSRTLTVNLLPNDATVCSCTEHLGEVRTVGAERTP